ncbi:hypothetical protein HHX38_08225 [Streptomyces sp. PKU-MA01144]|uniref:hypothetical protein n=1 Tax=Streptomyces sp. PKU-MA01144 TaxID=2729138 RepID=UPI0003686742|nr:MULTISPECIES: hypothetical protein [Streptomyces]MCY0984015.1 hypothetical protein [Streptomyces tirandamycinicus]NNJ04120.1 hypothetical protein [Streptomyces sp. PKU-MA01144]
METSGGSRTSAQHLPTQEYSVAPGPAAPRPGGPGGPGGAEGPCDLVTVPARQGLEAVDILRRGGAPVVGPVLHDGSCDTLGFLVPPGTAAGWDMPGSACTETSGRGIRIPGASAGSPVGPASEPSMAGSDWLLPPGDTGQAPLTDPVMLREALGEAARMIEAADSI